MWIVYRQRRSVTVADVPVSPLAVRGGFDALTDAIPALCLSTQLVHVGCHDLLADGVVCCCLVNEESAVVLFDHVPSIRGQQWGMGVMVDSASGVTRHQRERCFGATLPNDAGLAPCFSDPLCRLQVAGVVCPVLIELAPCFRLNGEHCVSFELI